MAFRDVFDRWQATGRDKDRFSASTVATLFGSTLKGSQVWRNLDADPTVSDEQREQLLEFLLLEQYDTPQQLWNRLCQFCHQPANQLTGGPDPVAQAATLGHVKSRSAWMSHFEGSCGKSSRGFAARRRRSATAMIDDLLGLPVDEQRRLLAGRTDARGRGANGTDTFR